MLFTSCYLELTHVHFKIARVDYNILSFLPYLTTATKIPDFFYLLTVLFQDINLYFLLVALLPVTLVHTFTCSTSASRLPQNQTTTAKLTKQQP